MTVTVYANNQTSHRILGVELELIQDTIFIASGGKILLPLMDFKFFNREFKITTTATATGTSLNKRFNEQNNGSARAL